MTQKPHGAKSPTKRRLLTVAAALFLLAVLVTAPVFAAAEEITYIKDPLARADADKFDTVTDYTTVTEGMTTDWEAGYYVVIGEVPITHRITVDGHVHLILTDGATLTAENGIGVYDDDQDPANGSPNSLTIYGQSGGTGKLIATGDQYYTGIGDSGDRFGGWLSGTIIINGGTIEATGGDKAAGIGGTYIGDYAYEPLLNCGAITINGGTVNAKGGTDAAGIGGGNGCSVSSITINGGVITATGGTRGAGIGGGEFGNGGNIVINSGIVKATGGSGAAGIGGGMDAGANVHILSGTVTAIGGDRAAGICSGYRMSESYTGTNSFSTGDPSAMQSAEAPFIIASSISDTSGKNQWRGAIFEGTSGKIYGQPVAIATNAEIPNGYTLTVDNGQTLINLAAISGDGLIQNNGIIINSGYLGVDVQGTGSKADLPNTESSFWTKISTLTDDMEEGYYLLSDDVTLENTWTPSNDIVLDLGGHVVNLSSTQTGSVITVNGGVTLTITDSGSTTHSFTEVDGLWVLDDNGAYSVQGGVITGGSKKNQETENGGGGVYVCGTFNLNAGNIVGNDAVHGGGVYVFNGVFNLNGGNIIGNNATDGGGGVYNYAGTLKLNGGSILENTAKHAGGVSLKSGSTEMIGGEIKGNTATVNGGGIYVEGGTFTVSGTAKVTENYNPTDNTPNNIFLATGKTITIADALSGDAMFSVTTEATTPVCITEEFSSDMSAFFRADNGVTAFYDAAEKKIYLNETRWYTVFWKNEDGTILLTNKTMYAGEIPEYSGTVPTKASDNTYNYVFKGWDKPLTTVTDTVTYTAQFTPIEIAAEETLQPVIQVQAETKGGVTTITADIGAPITLTSDDTAKITDENEAVTLTVKFASAVGTAGNTPQTISGTVSSIEAEYKDAEAETTDPAVGTVKHQINLTLQNDKLTTNLPKVNASIQPSVVSAVTTEQPDITPAVMITVDGTDINTRLATNGISLTFIVNTSWAQKNSDKLWVFHHDGVETTYTSVSSFTPVPGDPNNSTITHIGQTFSTYGLATGTLKEEKPTSSPSSQGSSVWLTETPTPTETVTPTPSETAPTDIPTTKPTEEPKSAGFGVLAVLGGLTAVAVLRRK